MTQLPPEFGGGAQLDVGSTEPEFKEWAAERFIPNLRAVNYGTLWASEEAKERHIRWRESKAARCVYCDSVVETSDGFVLTEKDFEELSGEAPHCNTCCSLGRCPRKERQ